LTWTTKNYHSLFPKCGDNFTTFALIYVDDIIIACSPSHHILSLISLLHKHFALENI